MHAAGAPRKLTFQYSINCSWGRGIKRGAALLVPYYSLCYGKRGAVAVDGKAAENWNFHADNERNLVKSKAIILRAK